MVYNGKQRKQHPSTDRFTLEERLDIGRRIYNGEISRYQAAEEYGISDQTARDYMRLYRSSEGLPPKRGQKKAGEAVLFKAEPAELNKLESMTKEELIREVMRARVREARLKKGYEVKGDGTVILYDIENTKS